MTSGKYKLPLKTKNVNNAKIIKYINKFNLHQGKILLPSYLFLKLQAISLLFYQKWPNTDNI
jgi:hypothetical protein